MRYLKAEILFLLVFVTDSIRTELDPDGKNVCLATENYKETVMVQVQKTKADTKWCWKGRCTKTTLVYEDEPRVFKRTRIVAKCCDGYKEETGQTDCVPVCLKECKNGKCVAPDTCACDPGFHGVECDKECPEGWWGVNCVNKCTCSDNGKCNKEKGCECKPGWMGDRCDLPCQEGYYGYSCEKKCKCDLSCNHETGECTTNTLTSAPAGAANYDPGTSTNSYQTTENDQNPASKGTEGHQISVPEISGTLKTKIFTEVVDETGSRSGEGMEIEDEINSEIAAEFPHSVNSMTEVTKSIKDAISANTIQITEPFATYFSTSKKPTDETTHRESTEVTKSIKDAISANTIQITERFTTYFTTSEKPTEETTQKEVHVKFRMQNEINFLEGLETSIRNASIKDTVTTEYATEVPRGDIVDKTIINNKTFWVTFSNTQQSETDETDNLINSEKGSASKDYLNTRFHFSASLTILSGISLVIFVIAAKWIIVSHKRRVQKLIITTQEKMLHTEQGKSQTQNLFWVSGCAENPVYLSEVDINKAVPILQTFKPANEKAAN